MQKIPTMFERDESQQGHPVIDRVTPGCEWVLAGEGLATVKMDGTNVKVETGALFKRHKPKGEYAEAGYVRCDRDNPADQWAFEAYDVYDDGPPDGIYELLGPKVQKNPYGYPAHVLMRVLPLNPDLCFTVEPRTFAGLRACLERPAVEGIVFHHPDGRLAKIKRRDFGLKWPL